MGRFAHFLRLVIDGPPIHVEDLVWLRSKDAARLDNLLVGLPALQRPAGARKGVRRKAPILPDEEEIVGKGFLGHGSSGCPHLELHGDGQEGILEVNDSGHTDDPLDKLLHRLIGDGPRRNAGSCSSSSSSS